MVAFSSIKPGDVLYQVVSQQAGNTTMRRQAVYTVVIEEVGEHSATVRWNGNPPRRMAKRDVEKLRRSKPKPKADIWDLARQARAARLARDSDSGPKGEDAVGG